MSDQRTGAFVVQHRYRVDPSAREQLLHLLALIRLHALDLGIAQFEAWIDDADPWLVSEVHSYDSWSQYQRLGAKALPADMEEVYGDLERLIEGGLGGIQTNAWNVAYLPDV